MEIFTCPASSHRSRRHEAAAASHIFLRRRQSYLCDWGTSASHIRRSPSQLYFMWWRRPEIEWTVNFQKNQTCCFHKKNSYCDWDAASYIIRWAWYTTVIVGGRAAVIVDDQLYYCQLCFQKVQTDKSSNISDIKTYALTSSTDSLRNHEREILWIVSRWTICWLFTKSHALWVSFPSLFMIILHFQLIMNFISTLTRMRREWVNFGISEIMVHKKWLCFYWLTAVTVVISRQRNSGYRPSRVNVMAQGLSTFLWGG